LLLVFFLSFGCALDVACVALDLDQRLFHTDTLDQSESDVKESAFNRNLALLEKELIVTGVCVTTLAVLFVVLLSPLFAIAVEKVGVVPLDAKAGVIGILR
jgi:hypothetical protein